MGKSTNYQEPAYCIFHSVSCIFARQSCKANDRVCSTFDFFLTWHSHTLKRWEASAHKSRAITLPSLKVRKWVKHRGQGILNQLTPEMPPSALRPQWLQCWRQHSSTCTDLSGEVSTTPTVRVFAMRSTRNNVRMRSTIGEAHLPETILTDNNPTPSAKP